MKRFIPLALLTLLLVVALTSITMPVSTPGAASAAVSVAAPALAPAAAPQPAQSAPPSPGVADLQTTLEGIYAQVNPSVVNIRVVESSQGMSPLIPQMPGFPNLPFQQPQGPQIQQGLGSGFVWDADGHIVTNNHVVDGATKISVTFSDGVTVPATVVGTDPASDMAVIQVDKNADKLVPVQLFDSNQLKVGQLVAAIGNPFGLQGTMTVGYVSGLGRTLPVSSNNGQQSQQGMQLGSYTIPNIIQTDASINPGNSGGVLVDDQGRVVGVTTAIERSGTGIGFAVPSAIVQKVVPALISTGHYDHPWIGISGTTLNPDLNSAMSLPAQQRGALVVQVLTNSPAAKAGVQGSSRQVTINGEQVEVGGDVIVAVNGQPVNNFDDVVTYLANNTQVGQAITLTVLRNGQQMTLNVTLEARPAATAQQPSANAATPTPGGAYLGILGQTLTSDLAQAMKLPANQAGVLIQQVQSGSPASAAGLRGSSQMVTISGQQVSIGGDVITAFNNQPVNTVQDLQGLIQNAKPGHQATLTVLRNGQSMTVTVTLAARPTSTP